MARLRSITTPEVQPVWLSPGEEVPNNPTLPLLFYPQVLDPSPGATPEDLALTFEALFDKHGWPGTWRNGIHSFHHYHSNAHEVLGIYEGEAEVLFGGPSGETVEVNAGDMVIVPAGVGHKKVRSRGRLELSSLMKERLHTLELVGFECHGQ